MVNQIAFDYDISKAIDIQVDKDEVGNVVIRLEFRYVTFRLKLDDKLKSEKLIELITGSVVAKPEEKKDIKIPRMYKSK